jgi:hypothetical protein
VIWLVLRAADHPGEDDIGQHLLLSDASLVDYTRAGQLIAWLQRAAEVGLFFHFDCPYCGSQMRSFTTTRTYEHQGKTCIRTICKTCFVTVERVGFDRLDADDSASGSSECQQCAGRAKLHEMSAAATTDRLGARHVATLEDAFDSSNGLAGAASTLSHDESQQRARSRANVTPTLPIRTPPAAQPAGDGAVMPAQPAMVLCQCTVPKLVCELCHVGNCSSCGRELCSSCAFYCEQLECATRAVMCSRCVCLCEFDCGSVSCNRCISYHTPNCPMPATSATGRRPIEDGSSSRAKKRRRRDPSSTWAIAEASQDSDPSSDVQSIGK